MWRNRKVQCPGPEVVKRLVGAYAKGRTDRETFKEFIHRIGKVQLRGLLEDLARPPADPSDRSIFTDWGDPREYSLDDMGVGECAGEVISAADFDLAGAEREVFEAQVAWENGRPEQAGKLAYNAMVRAARGLVKLEYPSVSEDSEQVVGEFRTRFYDTQKFFDPFAGGKFAHYLFAALENRERPHTADSARYLIDEAHLFVEAAHSCYQRMGSQ